jgi:hypothetical protein
MHDHNVYNSDDPDIKILPLHTSLRKGTEIETCDAKQFNLFQQRILERISILARDISAKGLISTENGTPQKIALFKDVWANHHGHYCPKENGSKSSPKSKNLDIYDIDSLPPTKGPSFKTPTTKMLSKGHQASPSTKV